jgi:hypothetical protein
MTTARTTRPAASSAADLALGQVEALDLGERTAVERKCAQEAARRGPTLANIDEQGLRFVRDQRNGSRPLTRSDIVLTPPGQPHISRRSGDAVFFSREKEMQFHPTYELSIRVLLGIFFQLLGIAFLVLFVLY